MGNEFDITELFADMTYNFGGGGDTLTLADIQRAMGTLKGKPNKYFDDTIEMLNKQTLKEDKDFEDYINKVDAVLESAKNIGVSSNR